MKNYIDFTNCQEFTANEFIEIMCELEKTIIYLAASMDRKEGAIDAKELGTALARIKQIIYLAEASEKEAEP